MSDLKILRPLKHPLFFILFLATLGLACNALNQGAYLESFNDQGKWGIGSSPDVEGQIKDGTYEMYVKDNFGLYIATAGENFSDGIYELEATQVEGPLNNGYGMIIRVSEGISEIAEDGTESLVEAYYIFEVSGDGYVWIGYCPNLCRNEAIPLVGGDWFSSPAVQKGLQATNRLRIVANGPRMTYFVNGVEVGRTTDNRLTEGDIGVLVETLGEGGVRVMFDNFKVTPPE